MRNPTAYLAQPNAITSFAITGYLGEETDLCLATASLIQWQFNTAPRKLKGKMEGRTSKLSTLPTFSHCQRCHIISECEKLHITTGIYDAAWNEIKPGSYLRMEEHQ